MSFRFRKSINIGGFRINLSKSGIGYSFGVKGLRFTRKAGGGTRTTIGIPSTGLSYVKDGSLHKKEGAMVNKEKERLSAPVVDEVEDELIQSSPHEMIDRLNRADKLDATFRICRIAFPVFALVFFAIFYAIVSNGMKWISEEAENLVDGTAAAIVCGILAVICIGASAIFLFQKVKFDPSYDFSEDARFETEYSNFMNAYSDFQTTKKIWEKQDDVPREKAEISFFALEGYIHTDLDITEVNLLRKKILFLPDIIAIRQQSGWAGVPYEEIEVTVQDAPTEEIAVPEDAKILSERWLHAKKDGGQDKRYENNYLIYNCQYEELILSSERGLNVNLICSSFEKARNFHAALEKYIEFIKE